MLAKSGISSNPYYVMSSAILHLFVCDEFDKKGRSFVWESMNEQRKVHLLNLDMQKKVVGGFGMRSMREANSTFIEEFDWCLLKELDSLQSRVVHRKYYNGRCNR